MKPTQITDLLANIKNSFVSFFSILMFAALGVGVFLGISWAGPALENAANRMFDEGSLHNYQIQFPYGLTDDDLGKLAAIEGVSQVEAERQSFQTIVKDERKYTVKVQSLGQSIDTPIVVEGELPANDGEIAIHAESARQLGVGLGDTITFEKDVDEGEKKADAKKDEDASSMKFLSKDSFTITAIVDNADYIAKSAGTYGVSPSPSGAINTLAWVPDGVFKASAFQDGYPVVNVRCDDLAGMDTFSDDYEQASNEIMEPIEALGTTLATARYDDLHDQAQKQIDEGQAKIDEGQAKIEKGEKEIADGEAQLAQARIDLDEAVAAGEAQLAEAYEKLQAGEATKSKAEKELSSARSKVNKGQAALDELDSLKAEGRAIAKELKSYKSQQDKELKAGKITQKKHDSRLDKKGKEIRDRIMPIAKRAGVKIPIINHTNYKDAISAINETIDGIDDVKVTVEGKKMTIGKAREELKKLKKRLSSAQSQFNAKSNELADGWNQYYAGQEELEAKKAEGEKAIADGEAKIKKAKQQVKKGKRQIAKNKPILEDARAKLAEMVKYEWTVMPRAYNGGAAEVSTLCGVTNNLSISMAALFIIVGLLVSYFAVSRIVHEQVTQIGTKKALGFRRGEITVSFLWYSGIAVLVGAIVGALVGFLLVEGIIGGVLGRMFAFESYPGYFGWDLFFAITGIELALVLGATYLACRRILKQHAVELLRGEKPPEGKTRFYEKWGMWDKLPLFIQTIVNNCVNDRRRVLSTIVGVAGCTALIVTAITLNNDVLKSYDRHYENVYGFNAIAFAAFEPEGAIGNVESALDGQGFATAQVFMKSYLLVRPDGNSSSIRAIVPVDEDAFGQLYHVNSLTDGTFALSGEGAWVSQAYAEHFGAKVGDAIVIDGGDGIKHEIPILGVHEFWLTYNEMVVNRSYFEKEFGPVTPNVVLCQTGETAVDDVGHALSSVEGFDSISDDASSQYTNFETFSKVSTAVVIIYLALAVLMAIVVLLNLNVMFIAEKKRELIVLMINGFGVKDARHYISYDSIVLTALGIVVGIVLGCLMGSITVSSIEPITAFFVKDVDATAVAAGVLGSTVLAIVMAFIALRRVNKFNLTDINRP